MAPQLKGAYLWFTKDTPMPAAVERFKERYGEEPQEVVKLPDYLAAGPVPRSAWRLRYFEKPKEAVQERLF